MVGVSVAGSGKGAAMNSVEHRQEWDRRWADAYATDAERDAAYAQAQATGAELRAAFGLDTPPAG